MLQAYCGDQLLWKRVREADNAWLRLKGLLGDKRLKPGEGLLLKPCGQIHMFFMKFPLDAVFLSKQGEVLRIVRLMPWQVSPWVRGAHSVLEVEAGRKAIGYVKVGDKLRFVRAETRRNP